MPFAPDADRRSLRELIAAGIFLNTDVGDMEKVVPKMSMMSLLASCSSGRLRIAAEALAAVEVEASGDKMYGMGSEPFEDFVAAWLRLRLLLAAECGSTVTLRHLLLGPLEHDHPTLGAALPHELMKAELRVSDMLHIDVVRITQDLVGYLGKQAGCALESSVI